MVITHEPFTSTAHVPTPEVVKNNTAARLQASPTSLCQQPPRDSSSIKRPRHTGLEGRPISPLRGQRCHVSSGEAIGNTPASGARRATRAPRGRVGTRPNKRARRSPRPIVRLAPRAPTTRRPHHLMPSSRCILAASRATHFPSSRLFHSPYALTTAPDGGHAQGGIEIIE